MKAIADAILPLPDLLAMTNPSNRPKW